MPSTETPTGMLPVKRLNGRPYNGGLSHYNIANSTTHNIFFGDPVQLQSGFIRRVTAADGADAIGVFMGCYYVDPNSKQPTWKSYYPANTSSAGKVEGRPNPVAMVCDDPDMVFKVQANASVTVADIGLNFNVTVSAGNTTFGMSRAHLVASSRASAAENGVRLVGFYDIPGNDPSNEDTANTKPIVLVMFNNHQLRRDLVSTS